MIPFAFAPGAGGHTPERRSFDCKGSENREIHSGWLFLVLLLMLLVLFIFLFFSKLGLLVWCVLNGGF